MEEGHAPPLHVLVHFCEDASAWLDEDPQHVLAVHCREGTERSGTLCASLLVFTRRFRAARDAIVAFERGREYQAQPCAVQGLLLPSQRRYVGYVETMVNTGMDFLGVTPKLMSSLRIDGVPAWLRRHQASRPALAVACQSRLHLPRVNMPTAGEFPDLEQRQRGV